MFRITLIGGPPALDGRQIEEHHNAVPQRLVFSEPGATLTGRERQHEYGFASGLGEALRFQYLRTIDGDAAAAAFGAAPPAEG